MLEDLLHHLVEQQQRTRKSERVLVEQLSCLNILNLNAEFTVAARTTGVLCIVERLLKI